MPKEYINYPVMTAFVHVIGDDSPEPDPIPAAPQVGLHPSRSRFRVRCGRVIM